MKELDGFSRKDLRIAERVIRLLKHNKLSEDELFAFNKFVSGGEHELHKKAGAEKIAQKKTRKVSGKTGLENGRRSRTPQPLKPGESGFFGLKCPCGGDVIIEGVCGRSVATSGMVRKGTCIECNKEFKIR
jgi:hypothetical protein